MGYETRQRVNEKSRTLADKHRELWEADEVAFLEESWTTDPADLEALAALLNRTVEACRQKHYDLAANADRVKKTVREIKSYTSLAEMGY